MISKLSAGQYTWGDRGDGRRLVSAQTFGG